ncbi:hypothetical protein [Streptomyces sp. NPDC005148]
MSVQAAARRHRDRHRQRREQIDAKLSAVPVARLFKEAPVSQAVQDVEADGARTARDLLDARVPGLGHMGLDRCSAEHAHTAARLLADNMEATLSVRVDSLAPGPRTVALQVLLEAGAEAHQTARTGEELASELERVLTEAEPASGCLSMLRAGRNGARSPAPPPPSCAPSWPSPNKKDFPPVSPRYPSTCCAYRTTGTSACQHGRTSEPHQSVLRIAGAGRGLVARLGR